MREGVVGVLDFLGDVDVGYLFIGILRFFLGLAGEFEIILLTLFSEVK